MGKNSTNPNVLALCKYCGCFYEIKSGEENKGNCGRESCRKRANSESMVSTPVTGTNINIITFTGDQATVGGDDGVTYIDVSREVDTSKRDLENAEKAEKEIRKVHGKRKTTKKTKSRRVSKRIK